MPGDVHELLNVCVINPKPELIKFELDFLEYFLFKLFGPLENLFHGHRGGQHASLPLDDALHELFDVVGELVVRGDEFRVFQEAVLVISTRADGEDGREDEWELFGAHGLDFEGVVYGGDVEDGVGLAGEDPCFFRDFYVVDSDSGDH